MHDGHLRGVQNTSFSQETPGEDDEARRDNELEDGELLAMMERGVYGDKKK